MRRLALNLAAALSLASGGPAVAGHHGGGGGHVGSGAHGGGARGSAPRRDFLGRTSHGPDVWQVLHFLNHTRRGDRPRGNSQGTTPPLYGGRLLGYADGHPYYCRNGHRVHWDEGVRRWTQWGTDSC